LSKDVSVLKRFFYKHLYRNFVIWKIIIESGEKLLESKYGKTDGSM